MVEQRLESMLTGAVERLFLLGVRLPESGVLAGAGKQKHIPIWPLPPEWSMGEDNGHYPLNYSFLLENGLPALAQKAQTGLERATTQEKKARFHAIARFLQAYIAYIAAHAGLAETYAAQMPSDAERYARIARNCRALTQRAPQSFEEGVQLFYFTWRFRSVNHTSCIGRLDVQLGALYERSRQSGMPREQARDLLCELIRKLNEMGSGDTLMNVMLGGVDADGNDVSNDLGLLIMECCGELGLSEPHVNVRLHRDTPDWFRSAACKLIARGQGQGTLYFDEHIIPELVKKGVPLPVARCYANDGCTEVTLEGNAGIVFWQMESMKALELALFNGCENPCAPHTPVRKWNRNRPAVAFESALRLGVQSGDVRQCASFDEFKSCFYRQYDEQLRLFCERVAARIIEDKQTDAFQSSLLVQSLTPRTLSTGDEPVRGGNLCDNYQLLSGSLPTVADSLYAIKAAVYEQRFVTMDELLEALRSNFEGAELLRTRLQALPKFGNDEDGVDALAAELAAHFCAYVEEYPFPCGVKVLPGMYNIDFMLFASVLGATPDGRKAGDAIGCHYSPTPGRAHRGATAAIHSASKGNLPRGVAASPVYITLPRMLDTDYAAVVGSLAAGCEALRLPIVNLSIVSVDELRDAQVHPEKHRDLVVRVWGYNAYFVDLDDELQRHIIDRTLGAS